MSAGVPQCGDDPTGRATPSKQSPVVSLAMEQWIVDSARAPDCAAVAVFVDDAADSGAPFPSSGGQWSRRRRRRPAHATEEASSLGASLDTAHSDNWAAYWALKPIRRAFLWSDPAARFLSNCCNDLQGRTVNEMPSTPGRGTSHRPPLSPRGHRRSPPPVACRSTVGPRTPILSREDASGEMPRERLPAGRLGAARASALGTAAKRDGHALRGPRSRSICFLGCRRRLLLRRLEAGRMEDVPVALLGG